MQSSMIDRKNRWIFIAPPSVRNVTFGRGSHTWNSGEIEPHAGKSVSIGVLLTISFFRACEVKLTTFNVELLLVDFLCTSIMLKSNGLAGVYCATTRIEQEPFAGAQGTRNFK